MVDGIRAIPYSPTSLTGKSPAKMRVPTAIITVDPATPINRWKLPVAEDLPISKALSM
jgi:hypothetical protein